jgi:mono/diheme cytochrome c family protein
MIRRLFAITIITFIAGIVGFAALTRPAVIASTAVPLASSFAPDLIARGEILAGAGSCVGCHTSKGGKPLAGGYAINSEFGVIYSTNITPDAKTGIGAWSEEAFRRAIREGIARDGTQLFPALPYDHFTKVTDDDVSALYAYLMSREPVHAQAIENTLPFPLNIRALQAGWKLLSFRSGRFEPRQDRQLEWNRGAYLAEGVGHCGACHTPRNKIGAEVRERSYAGGIVDGHDVPPLTKANFSPVPWSEEELFNYLRGRGTRFHGRPGGSMRAIVRDGLIKLPDADIRSLAVYFADVGDATSRTKVAEVAIERARAADDLDFARRDEKGAALYMSACASCHYSGGATTNTDRPNLALVSSVNEPDPSKLARVILYGHKAEMPGFGQALQDSDIARIAAYLRSSRTAAAPWPDLEKKVAALRQLGSSR